MALDLHLKLDTLLGGRGGTIAVSLSGEQVPIAYYG